MSISITLFVYINTLAEPKGRRGGGTCPPPPPPPHHLAFFVQLGGQAYTLTIIITPYPMMIIFPLTFSGRKTVRRSPLPLRPQRNF